MMQLGNFRDFITVKVHEAKDVHTASAFLVDLVKYLSNLVAVPSLAVF